MSLATDVIILVREINLRKNRLRKDFDILCKRITELSKLCDYPEDLPKEKPDRIKLPRHVLLKKLNGLEFSARVSNILENLNIQYVGECFMYSRKEMQNCKNFGSKSERELTAILLDYLKKEKIKHIPFIDRLGENDSKIIKELKESHG